MGNRVRKRTKKIAIIIMIIASIFALNYNVLAASPSINITEPSEVYNETTYSYATVNVSVTDGSNQVSTFIDWNESLVAYWNFESLSPTGVYDNSTHSNFGTFSGGLLESDNTTGKFGTAIDLDGVNEYIDCGSAGHGQYTEMTIEAWIRRDSDTPTGWKTPLHRNDGTSVGSSVFFIGIETGVNYQIVATIGSGSLGNAYMSGKTGVNSVLNTWYHVVNSWDGTTARVYVDGIEKVSYALDSANFNIKAGAKTMIGTSWSSSGYSFNGQMDEIRIWSRALNHDEINASYNSTVKNFLNKNFTELVTQNYSYYAHAINTAGEESNTSTQYIDVTLPIVDVTKPTSNINNIIPYVQSTTPLTITATADDDLDGVANVTLYYKHSTDNITWAEVSENWWNENWTRRKLITVNSSQVAGTLTNFPILVYSDSDGSLLGNAQDDGDDIIFILHSDNTTQLNHEIEKYDNLTGSLHAWVNVTSLSSLTDTKIWMYYGNSTCDSQQNKHGTWDSHYKIVQHLEETPANGVTGHLDSTSNNNNGTAQNFNGIDSSTTNGTGKIDGADVFDGTNDYVFVNNNFIVNPTSLTISSWIKKEDGGHTYECALHKGSASSIGSSEYWLGVCTDDYLTATIGARTSVGWGAGKTGITADYGEWYYLVASWNGTVVRVYINGAYNKKYDLGSSGNIDKPTRFGASTNGTNYQFKGTIDEVRISDSSRSAEWIATEYATIKNQTTFIAIGDEEGGGWTKYTNDTNPDLNSPWSWSFTFPNSTGYYEFYSRAYDNNSNHEDAPITADTLCNYTESADWDSSQPIAWKIVNITDIVILNLSTSGNISIAGTLHENTVTPPALIAFTMNNSLWLTKSGDLYLEGEITAVSSVIWKIENVANVEILKLSSSGDLFIAGSLFENV